MRLLNDGLMNEKKTYPVEYFLICADAKLKIGAA